VRTNVIGKYQEAPVLVVSNQRPRPSGFASREPESRLAGTRRKQLGFDELWSNAVAFISLAARIGMVVLLVILK
jgi:hypothetical protein